MCFIVVFAASLPRLEKFHNKLKQADQAKLYQRYTVSLHLAFMGRPEDADCPAFASTGERFR
jgi:hypothetical protein